MAFTPLCISTALQCNGCSTCCTSEKASWISLLSHFIRFIFIANTYIAFTNAMLNIDFELSYNTLSWMYFELELTWWLQNHFWIQFPQYFLFLNRFVLLLANEHQSNVHRWHITQSRLLQEFLKDSVGIPNSFGML